MIINKITYGFVVQQFDTEQLKWVNQKFIGDSEEIKYADEGEPGVGDRIDAETALNEYEAPYLNLDMVQPA
jgi:hypothetical protein